MTALTTAWARTAASGSSRRRQVAEADRLRTEIALLKEELETKDAGWGRVPARRRPHYGLGATTVGRMLGSSEASEGAERDGAGETRQQRRSNA